MLSHEMEIAVAAARAAGAAVMRLYGSREFVSKADDSPVTAADRISNETIVEHLADSFPGDTILSEESRSGWVHQPVGRVWIVDPLDGTREFITGNGEFAVMIGLAINGEPVLGAVFAPAAGALYGAVRGQGAWVERNGTRRVMRCPPEEPGRPPRLIGSRSHADPIVSRLGEELGITDTQPCGSVGIKCARIAEGERDLYVHPGSHLKEWDTCAPEVILSEAGGWVSDCAGRPLRYSKALAAQPGGILAAIPAIAPAALAALGRLMA